MIGQPLAIRGLRKTYAGAEHPVFAGYSLPLLADYRERRDPVSITLAFGTELCGRRLATMIRMFIFADSDEFADEPLRIAERSIKLPDSDVSWDFMVAQSRDSLDAQVTELRSVLVISFLLLALGLIILAALQTFYGLWPLRTVRKAIAEMRSGRESRVTEALPDEVMPMVNELNALLDHNEKQAEESGGTRAIWRMR